MSPSLNIQSTAGQQLTLVPVPMKFLPRSDSKAWRSFVTDRADLDIQPEALTQIQSFMDANDTDAVTDGHHFYTVNAGLMHCAPERITDSVRYELRINGETFLSGDASLRVIFRNLNGANFETPCTWRAFTHEEYMAMMEREFSFQAAGAVLTYHVAGNDTSLLTHTFQAPEVVLQ
ncbi:DUF7688 family protein [Pseudomonas sp. NPDC089569]|uniref:DUF7688 family protein n=1 Tax=Pseudomonas sp. NPDC089569 TaxID=3390722 RepID=UPI003D035AF4